MIDVRHGDSRDVLKSIPDGSIDSCCTDPPYALVSIVKRFGKNGSAPAQDGASGVYKRASAGFMGQQWDTGETAFDPDFWAEVWRVLKPGAHLLAFSGTRTYHRMVCAIEDAGFEIRDQIGWTYGSGFPKSHDVSKAIDKANGVEFSAKPASGVGFMGPDRPGGYNRTVHQLERIGQPTDEAVKWQGWGTALKPSHEPVVIAQKPYYSEQEWVTIGRLIERLWSALWLTLPASDAEQFSTLNPRAYGVEPSDFAQWTAAQQSNTRAALSVLTDTLPSGSALISSLYTVSSWSGTLAASCRAASTSITETGSSATTDLRTLRCCLSQITPASIILAHKTGQWSSANACNAGRLFCATVAMLNATLELSAAESATDWQAINCPDGGAIRPNWEPIVVARKPLIGTVAANVMAHGTGALNIDGCRVEWQSEADAAAAANGFAHSRRNGTAKQSVSIGKESRGGENTYFPEQIKGRWPANLVHDGSPEVLACFPETQSGAMTREVDGYAGVGVTGMLRGRSGPSNQHGDSGSAARFFYTAKADAGDRLGSKHPTVKPVDLMRWLCRLVTPSGGLVLDPFAGSGTTGMACMAEGFDAILIEREANFVEDIKRRIAHVSGQDAPLFAGQSEAVAPLAGDARFTESSRTKNRPGRIEEIA